MWGPGTEPGPSARAAGALNPSSYLFKDNHNWAGASTAVNSAYCSPEDPG